MHDEEAKGGCNAYLGKKSRRGAVSGYEGGGEIRKHVAWVQQDYETGARGGGRRVRHHEDCPCGVIEKDCGGHDEHS